MFIFNEQANVVNKKVKCKYIAIKFKFHNILYLSEDECYANY